MVFIFGNFYTILKGMDYQNKRIIDASWGGSIGFKKEEQAYQVLVELGQNSFITVLLLNMIEPLIPPNNIKYIDW